MKKTTKIIVIALCAAVLLGGGTVLAKAVTQKEEYDMIREEAVSFETPEITSFTYGGKEYELKTEDQKEFFKKNSESGGCFMNPKAILKYLGVLEQEDKPYTLKEVEEVLNKLDKSAGAYEVVLALDTLAGACDRCGGSGWMQYHYSLVNGSGITVEMSGATAYTETVDGKPVFRTIWYPGMGFKAEGWTWDEINQYNRDRKNK